MSQQSSHQFELHHDQDVFKSLIEFTTSKTGFQAELIEKDYFCSLILHQISLEANPHLIFKGGTLLAKAHAGFYRLSEDLDFSISTSPNATRKQRSQLVEPIKNIMETIENNIDGLYLEKQISGSNESRQYNGILSYDSLVAARKSNVFIEISLRSELVLPSDSVSVSTALLNPFTQEPMIKSFTMPSLSKLEAYAEKVSASLTRDRLAIRDFFDIYQVLKHNIIDFSDESFTELVRTKIIAGEKGIIEFNDVTFKTLYNKISSELRPTLRHQDVGAFDLLAIIERLERYVREELRII